MTLEDLGYHPALETYRKDHGLDVLGVGRVIAEHKDRVVVRTPEGEYEGELLGNLRYTARDRSDLPVVGDWVAIAAYDQDKVLVHAVYPRSTVLERQAVGKQGEKQLIATNMDVAFVVQAVDQDFNLNRIERYLTLCYTSGVKPFLLLSKIDLLSAGTLSDLLHRVHQRIKQVPVFPLSNVTQQGFEALRKAIEKGKTYCLLGSSGVGKSTLLNNLSGKPLMKTGKISEHTQKGRHVTSHRALVVLENGGILIDNPGMREVGIADAGEGLSIAFNPIMEWSEGCKFSDCTHTQETGCAVLQALERGELDRDSYGNYLKMEREKKHFGATVAEKRRKDKEGGKMMKRYKKSNYKKY